MNLGMVAGEGNYLPPLSGAKKEKAMRLIVMNLMPYSEMILVWPKNASLVVGWSKLDAKMQERK